MLTNPLVPLISRLKLTPDMMTFTGIVLNLVAAVVIGFGYLLAGGIIFLLAGLFDLLDGALARYMEKTTRFGALLDSTADRSYRGCYFPELDLCHRRIRLAVQRNLGAGADLPGPDWVLFNQLYKGQGRGAEHRLHGGLVYPC